MDHDRAFKLLLNTFFLEFVEAFLPTVAGYLEPASIEFLPLEIFTDILEGEEHEVDLIVKARFLGQDGFFLIHVENQASAQTRFPFRMFSYAARLHMKYQLPVYPVVIFSYNRPKRLEPDRYEIAFPDKTVLQFEYTVIQLNRLDWRNFITTPNPVATALLAKMKIAKQDRVKVRQECMRLLRTLKLDPARSKLIGGFVDTYLTLTAEEMKQYEREFASLTLEEQEETMEIISSWEKKGIEQGLAQGLAQGVEQGLHDGKESLVARLIKRRFGSVSSQVKERLDGLSADQLDELGEALLDFAAIAELETWLSQQQHQ